MKDFILLHERNGVNEDGTPKPGLPLLLRPCLFDYAESFNDGSTTLHMEGGKEHSVIETPDKIYELLEE